MNGAKSLLAIGCRYGYTLVDMALRMPAGAKIVAVDLPDQEGWNDQEAVKHLEKNVDYLKSEGFDAHLIIGDSHKQETWEKVAPLVPMGTFDIVFIDGDHTYEGVNQDWKDYGQLGKVVLFHDIREPKPPEWMGMGVWKLWNEVKKLGGCEEFLAPGSKMGIGKFVRFRNI